MVRSSFSRELEVRVPAASAEGPAAAGHGESFTDLGAQAIRLAGYGTRKTFLGVNQSQFGDPVSVLTLQLRAPAPPSPPAVIRRSRSTGTSTCSSPGRWMGTASTSLPTPRPPPVPKPPASAAAFPLAAIAPARPAPQGIQLHDSTADQNLLTRPSC